MKEQYIRQVEKHLTLPRKAKQEVIRDLNEIFASALENGETEQQVIDRLGTRGSVCRKYGGTVLAERNGFRKITVPFFRLLSLLQLRS